MKFKLTKNKAFRLLGILFVFIGIFLFVGDRFDFADPTQGNDISENIVNNVSNIEETSQEIENNDEADESLETEDSTTSKTKDENLTSEKEKADVKEGEEKEETATEKNQKQKKIRSKILQLAQLTKSQPVQSQRSQTHQTRWRSIQKLAKINIKQSPYQKISPSQLSLKNLKKQIRKKQRHSPLVQRMY